MTSFFTKASFPKVVVGNLSLLLLFSYKTTDPRLNSSGMTATATTDPVTLRAEHRATTSAKKKLPGYFPGSYQNLATQKTICGGGIGRTPFWRAALPAERA